MGGVDRSDQMISYTNSIVKSFKWWEKVIFHVLAIAVLRRSSCCGALTGLPALTTTAIALFCTSSVTSFFLKTLPDLSAQKRKRPGHETAYECQVCNVSLYRLFHSYQEYALAYKRWKTASIQFI
jgi:hypothetical protein